MRSSTVLSIIIFTFFGFLIGFGEAFPIKKRSLGEIEAALSLLPTLPHLANVGMNYLTRNYGKGETQRHIDELRKKGFLVVERSQMLPEVNPKDKEPIPEFLRKYEVRQISDVHRAIQERQPSISPDMHGYLKGLHGRIGIGNAVSNAVGDKRGHIGTMHKICEYLTISFYKHDRLSYYPVDAFHEAESAGRIRIIR